MSAGSVGWEVWGSHLGVPEQTRFLLLLRRRPPPPPRGVVVLNFFLFSRLRKNGVHGSIEENEENKNMWFVFWDSWFCTDSDAGSAFADKSKEGTGRLIS